MSTTPLAKIIAAEIRDSGPLSISRYMEYCLGHPEYGYYHSQPSGTDAIFGKQGDFTTAPEVSQVFGELVGAWLLAETLNQQLPRLDIAELGPGRGTMMADMLRLVSQLQPALLGTGSTIHLIETSRLLRQTQNMVIGRQLQTPLAQRGRDSAAGSPLLQWHDSLETLPEAPLMMVANEFFDALPIRQFAYDNGNWHERLVSHDGDRFQLTLGPPATIDSNAACFALPADMTMQNGMIAEYCPAAETIITQIAAQIARHGGACLIIDYAKPDAAHDTLQAVRRHRPVGIFDSPGETDLSAMVCLPLLGRLAEHQGCRVAGPVAQGVFLRQLGIAERTEQLAAGNRAAEGHTQQNRALLAAVERLVSPAHMGQAFEVMAILPPAGFYPQLPISPVAGFAV